MKQSNLLDIFLRKSLLQSLFGAPGEKKCENCSENDYIPLVSSHVPAITRTCLYNVDPLEPHFYIVKLGFTGAYIIFLFLLKNINCGYSLEPPRRGGSNEYPQSMF